MPLCGNQSRLRYLPAIAHELGSHLICMCKEKKAAGKSSPDLENFNEYSKIIDIYEKTTSRKKK